MLLPKHFCCKKSWSLLMGSKIITIIYTIFTVAALSGLTFIWMNETTFQSLTKMQPPDYLLIGKSLFPQAAYDSNSFESNNVSHPSAVTKKNKSVTSNPISTKTNEITTLKPTEAIKKEMSKDANKIESKTTTKKPGGRKVRNVRNVSVNRRRRSLSAKSKQNKDNLDLFINNILIAAIVFHGIYFEACIFLMIGIWKRSLGFVVPWVLVEIFRQLGVLAIWGYLCYLTNDILNRDPDDGKFAIPLCAVILVVIALNFYFWLVICSFYKELRGKRHTVIPKEKDDGTIDS